MTWSVFKRDKIKINWFFVWRREKMKSMY